MATLPVLWRILLSVMNESNAGPIETVVVFIAGAIPMVLFLGFVVVVLLAALRILGWF
jgi:hypothetical protein